MTVHLSIDDLLAYTDWEREKWHALFRSRGAALLAIDVGPNGDGRFQTIGEVIRHIFSAEKRYVERLQDRQLTDTSVIPADDVDRLFEFGEQSRRAFREFLASWPAQGWDEVVEFPLMNSILSMTPRKVVVHVQMHEIRHWAQIATLLRLQGVTDDFHDFLFSPALGGGVRAAAR